MAGQVAWPGTTGVGMTGLAAGILAPSMLGLKRRRKPSFPEGCCILGRWAWP